jgi:hypothetical protein
VYLGTYLQCIFIFSCCKLQLTRYLPFFCNKLCMQCNAMQYLVEHWPLLITVYPQLIFGKSCRNFFLKFWEKTRENLTTLIWIFQNFNNNSH